MPDSTNYQEDGQPQSGPMYAVIAQPVWDVLSLATRERMRANGTTAYYPYCTCNDCVTWRQQILSTQTIQNEEEARRIEETATMPNDQPQCECASIEMCDVCEQWSEEEANQQEDENMPEDSNRPTTTAVYAVCQCAFCAGYVQDCDCGDCRTAIRHYNGEEDPMPERLERTQYTYCDPPTDEEYAIAERTGQYIYNDSCDDHCCEDCWPDGCGDYHCSDCYPDGPEENGCNCYDCQDQRYYAEQEERESMNAQNLWPVPINGYSHKPNPVFWSVGGFSTQRLSGRLGNRGVFMGCEVEVEIDHNGSPDRYDLANAFTRHNDIASRIYCKHDGSLDNGVEIVSHPMSLDAWHELLDVGEMSLYSDLRNAGTYTPGSCGMHVHIKKSSFLTRTHLYRFALLILANENPYSDIAGRWNAGYAPFEYGWLARYFKHGSMGPRCAVNLQGDRTAEIRMFASIQEPNKIIANLETVHACHAYTLRRDPSLPLNRALTFASFASWVRTQESTYPYLCAEPAIANAESYPKTSNQYARRMNWSV